MLKSLFGLATDVVKIVAAPVEIAANVTRELVTKPIAEMAEEIIEETRTEDDED